MERETQKHLHLVHITSHVSMSVPCVTWYTSILQSIFCCSNCNIGRSTNVTTSVIWTRRWWWHWWKMVGNTLSSNYYCLILLHDCPKINVMYLGCITYVCSKGAAKWLNQFRCMTPHCNPYIIWNVIGSIYIYIYTHVYTFI